VWLLVKEIKLLRLPEQFFCFMKVYWDICNLRC